MIQLYVCATLHMLVVSLLACSSCCFAEESRFPEPISIVSTTTIIADTARIIAGPFGRVTSLMGPGVDPHLYKASPNDLRALSKAAIIFHHGLHLEGTMADALERLASRKTVVAVSKSIPIEKLRLVAGGGATSGPQYDPHVWFDPALWIECANTIRSTLTQYDPQHALEYTERFEDLRSELLNLDSWVRQQIQTIPSAHRILITAHDAFGYFARAYGLEVSAIQGVSTESEASLRSINELVSKIVSSEIPAIFLENTISPKTVEALIQGAKARGHTVRIGGLLLGDSLGNTGTPEASYVGAVRYNVNTIVAGLTSIPAALTGTTTRIAP